MRWRKHDLGEKTEGIIFKKVDFMRLNAAVRKVNNVLRFFKTSNITETNNLIAACFVWVSRQLGLKKARRDTLVVLIFAGINFRAFRGFCPKSRKFVSTKYSILLKSQKLIPAKKIEKNPRISRNFLNLSHIEARNKKCKLIL